MIGQVLTENIITVEKLYDLIRQENIMIFNKNQSEFESNIHKAVWAAGKSVVPFELSTAEITDPGLLEGLRQVYDFTLDILSDMYNAPDKYELQYGENCLSGNGSVTSFHSYLCSMAEKVQLIDNYWSVDSDQIKNYHKLDLLSSMGITYKNNGNETKIISEKYPLFLKYYYLCYEASLRRKVNCFNYVMSCDFRIFNKKFGRKLNDTLIVLSDRDKAYALELHNYLLSRGIKNKPCQYYNRITYEYKNQFVMNIEILGSTYLFFQVSLGKNINDPAYGFIVNEIEKESDKEELQKYIAENITCCNMCFAHKTLKKRCGRWADIFGRRRLLCFEFCLSNKKKSERNIIYSDYDIRMLKRFLDMRIKAIDSICG
jgi:hypothetical protein